MRRSALRLVLLVIGVGLITAVGMAAWSAPSSPRAGPDGTAGGSLGPPAVTAVANQVRTSTAHGSHAGYDLTVLITRTGSGSRTLARMDLRLSTQATPASAPTAGARLVGPDQIGRDVPLTIVGAGYWTSADFPISPGRYRLTARFDRKGGPVNIPVTLVLT